MLSNDLELTLRRALTIASEYEHEYATYEHLLLALMEDRDVNEIFVQNNFPVDSVRKRLILYLEHDLAELVDKKSKEAKPTAGFQRIVQRAALHGQASGDKIINGLHVLAEFFFEHDSFALICLREENLSRQDIFNYIKKRNEFDINIPEKNQSTPVPLLGSQIKAKSDNRDHFENMENDSQYKQDEASDITKFCVNLNERANTNSIDCLIGRQNEIQRVIEILCRRKKNNAILVGEPGVGKTAIAEGLAIRIVKGDVPDLLKKSIIYSLDMGSIVAGTKFRGDFEERIKALLSFLRKNKDAILFIDEIHTIIGAGSTNSGATDASNLLKPALGKGELKCIGSTTFKEYHNYFEKDMALVRRFQKVVVEEPDAEASMEILKGLKGYYEKHHGVKYADSALRAAINLSERYINNRHLPDKAIDLIDEVGARSKMNNSVKTVTITNKHIEELLSRILNMPSIGDRSDEINQLRQLSKNLKKCIFGQDQVIEDLCASIKLSKAGLKKGRRPTGCYLFVGPTGVGKTELAKQLAIFNNMKLIKFDMSEFSESSAVSKLLGSAPGYVGFDQGGMLTEEVAKYPYSVVLFDEIEKAHSEIFSILLQIMDEGNLTDSTGKHVNFMNTMIILTTNIAAEKVKSIIGFNDSNQINDAAEQFDFSLINERFSPEFRSRLDNIVLFNPIDGIINQIISKSIKELASQLADKKVRLNVSSAVKNYFAEKCLKNNGARTLDRTIDTHIKQAIADAILFGQLRNGGTVSVDLCKKSQEITFKFTPVNNSDAEIEELEVN
jgi:ATP-dependent Clp protease ATP-binding subunit ClpA